MTRRITILIALTALAVALPLTAYAQMKPNKGARMAPKEKEEKPDPAKVEGTALAFTMKDIDGAEQDLSQYYGKVILIVNTASKCGYTPQYSKLQELYEKYTSQGFVILGFPCNQFGKQEPGTEEEIKTFCKTSFGVAFPMFAKVDVNGEKACELYKYLTGKETNEKFAGEIKWNFTKFLIDREGKVVGRYKPSDDPVKCKQLIQDLEKALGGPAGASH